MQIYEHLTDAEKQGIVDLNGFKPLQDSGFKPLISFTPPMVSIGISSIGFLKMDDTIKPYARFMFNENSKQVMVMFSDKKEYDSFKLSTGINNNRITNHKLINLLSELAGLDLKNYNYRFKPILNEPKVGRVIFSYGDKPFAKTKKKGLKHGTR